MPEAPARRRQSTLPSPKRIRVLFLVPLLAAKDAAAHPRARRPPLLLKPYHLHDFLEKVGDLLVEAGAIAEPIRSMALLRRHRKTARHSRRAQRKAQRRDVCLPRGLSNVRRRIAGIRAPGRRRPQEARKRTQRPRTSINCATQPLYKNPHFTSIPRLAQQLRHALPHHRMHHLRRNLRKRHQHEPPLRHSRMRNLQARPPAPRSIQTSEYPCQ